MAVVVSSASEKNIGLFVDVIAASACGQSAIELKFDNGPIWYCKARGLIRYETVCGKVLLVRDGPIPDSSLRPIRPRQSDGEAPTKCEIDQDQFA